MPRPVSPNGANRASATGTCSALYGEPPVSSAKRDIDADSSAMA
jgi:hypothetical protein